MMTRTKSLPRRKLERVAAQTIPNHLAHALVGQTVSLLGRSKTIRHGVVAGVITQTGRPMLVVDRVEYDLSQVLSITPPAFN
jgi:hypothetical protein